jgi:uncharacterized protein YkwD
MRKNVAAVLVAASALVAQPAVANEAESLLGLINDYRSSKHRCDGKPAEITGPLAADGALAVAASRAGGELGATLRTAGYAAARWFVIDLMGPRDAAAAMRLLSERYCRELSSARYSEIGIARGEGWRIVLAQPVLSPELGSSPEAGLRILELVNAARAEPRTCGNRRLPAVPPIRWNATLATTALAHSDDMARRDYFAHTAPDGTEVGARARRQGYVWRTIGENIAAGQSSAQRVTAAWLASPGHCRNIMDGAFTEMGAAYAVNVGSTSTIYWTQVFGDR